MGDGKIVNEQARSSISVLRDIGQVVERMLSNPSKRGCEPVPILGDGHFCGQSLLEIWQLFPANRWIVVEFKGAIYKRRTLTAEEKALKIEWGFTHLPDSIKFKAVVLCIMRTKAKEKLTSSAKFLLSRGITHDYEYRVQISELAGEDLRDLLKAFTGRRFTDDELLQCI
jgi:hypothetical protein